MADQPTLKDIRAATLVDPKSKKPVSLEKYRDAWRQDLRVEEGRESLAGGRRAGDQ